MVFVKLTEVVCYIVQPAAHKERGVSLSLNMLYNCYIFVRYSASKEQAVAKFLSTTSLSAAFHNNQETSSDITRCTGAISITSVGFKS